MREKYLKELRRHRNMIIFEKYNVVKVERI